MYWLLLFMYEQSKAVHMRSQKQGPCSSGKVSFRDQKIIT